MHAVVRAALAVAILAAGSSAAERGSKPRTLTITRSVAGESPDELSSLCPAGFLPDMTHCVPIPEREAPTRALSPQAGAHRERTGLWRIYEQIPRRPDRPAKMEAYRFPIEPPSKGSFVLSSYDLDQPDPQQRRTRRVVGHGGLDLAQARGSRVRAVKLENQKGDAEVVFVGSLFGRTVVTKHVVREGGRDRNYLVIHGHLEAPAPGLVVGARLRDGDPLGLVGDSGSEGNVHLHLEVRQVRDGANEDLLRSQSLAQGSVSIPCDPRNLLPLKR